MLQWKGFPLKKARETLRTFNSLKGPSKENWIEGQKRSIAQYHLGHNSFYREICKQNSFSEWEELPVLSKQDFQRPLRQMVSDLYSLSNVYISNTSGSSGHPFFFAKDKFCHALTWAFIFECYNKLNIGTSDRQARFYGIPLDRLSYFKEKLKDLFMHRIRFPVFDLSDVMLEKFLYKFQKSNIHYIYGYTNSILLFSNFLLRRHICLKDVCPTLTRCIVTSEVCLENDKALIAKALGVPVSREYGASELDVIAMEDIDNKWAMNEANLFVEVLSDENRVLPVGEEGRLVITSLHNRAMPFIRYDIGDIGALGQDQDGLYLKKLSGRVNDTIILPSGKKSPGLTFYYISRSILESSGILKEFIIRQTALDSFEFDVISDRPLTRNETQEIKSKMDIYLEPGLNLRINRVEKINRPASGKIKHFYSEIIR